MGKGNGARTVALVVGAVVGCLTLLGTVAAYAWSYHNKSTEGISGNSVQIGANVVSIKRNETELSRVNGALGKIADKVGEMHLAIAEIRAMQKTQTDGFQTVNDKLDILLKLKSGDPHANIP